MDPTNQITAIPEKRAANTLLALGIAHIPLLGFHFAFPWLFGWSTELPLLSNDNAGLLLCFHLCGMFWLGSMGAATIIDALRLREGRPGIMPRGFWLWMASFYLFRALVEIPCFGVKLDGVVVIALVFALAAYYWRAWSEMAPTRHDPGPERAIDHRFDF